MEPRRRAYESRRAATAVVALMFAAAAFAGCAGGGSSASTASAAQASEAVPTPSASSSSPPACPNVEGGACLGALDARTAYTTQIFTPALSYQVPTQGWRNYEDTPGNFLLVPPGNDLPGVNAGTSDFIGTYTSVAPARLTDPKGCIIQTVPGDWTPAKMAAYYRQRPNLTTSRPVRITIGGLTGVMLDMRTKPGSKLDVCTVEGQRLALAGEFNGLAPSSLQHAVIPGMTMRMIMLNSAGNVLLVEIDDIDNAPLALPALTAVARQMRFGA